MILFPSLHRLGLWEPQELASAELSRRIAVHVFHAHELALPSAKNALPTLTELGSGELGQDSSALGFKVFGLRAWAGRVPLALWGLASIGALFEFFAAAGLSIVGLCSSVALASMPLFVAQSTTLGSDIALMSSLSMSVFGLGRLLIVRPPAKAWGAAPWFLIALLGLAAGLLSRGLWLGVAVPLLAVSAAWFALHVDELRLAPRGRLLLAAGAMLLGLTSAALFALEFDAVRRQASPGFVGRLVGFAIDETPSRESSFDLVIRDFGHAAFPLSAIAPFALAALFGRHRATFCENSGAARLLLLNGVAVTYAGFAAIGPSTASMAFGGAPFVAAAIGLWLADLETATSSARCVALGIALVGFMFYRDLALEPARVLVSFGMRNSPLPEAFEHSATLYWRTVSLAMLPSLGAIAAGWWPHRANAPSAPLGQQRALLSLALLPIAGVGLSFAHWFHPELAAQVCPERALRAFAAYKKGRPDSAPLGLLGVNDLWGPYFDAQQTRVEADVDRAIEGLHGGDTAARRFLLLRSESLAPANARYRRVFGANLPVVDSEGGRFLLASNSLDGAINRNPLEQAVFSDPLPRDALPAHPLSATFAGSIETLGWEIRDEQATPPGLVDTLRTGRKYTLRLFFRVLEVPDQDRNLFVHIDGMQRRHNADHSPLSGRYPMTLWSPGDILIDAHEFEFEPNFGPGTYALYYGFYSGEARLAVTAGSEPEEKDGRVFGGAIELR